MLVIMPKKGRQPIVQPGVEIGLLVFLGRKIRAVGCVGGEIDEEGFVLVVFHEVDGGIGKNIGAEAFALHGLAIVL